MQSAEPPAERGSIGLELAGERGTIWVTRSGSDTEIRGCQLTHIAMLICRPLRWDPKTETIVDDDESCALLALTPRAGWALTT